MPFRERVKRVLRRTSNKSSSSSSSLSKSTTKSTSNPPFPDPSIIYQPGEKMPTPKYRRPVAKEHKEKLEAFSFGNAWRRKSFQSVYSPMGSRMPSRRNSATQPRRSFQEMRAVGDAVDEGTDEEGDVTNVGISRRPSHDHTSQSHSDSSSYFPQPSHENDGTSEQPFTAEDLTLALKKSHLSVPR